MGALKVGVIGAGYWGPNIIRNFVEISGVDVVAVADLDQLRLDHINERYPQVGCTLQDYREMFEMELDAVAVCTPPQTHFSITTECLEQGLHVLVEKPLATSSDDVRRMIQVAEKNDRVLMVGHTFEFNPAVHMLKELIVSGELGEIRYIDAVRVGLGLFHPSLNVVWDLAPHDISILLYLLDALPYSVAATGVSCVQPGVEDVAYLSLMFPNEVLSHIRVSWLDPSKTRRVTVVGSKKMAIYDDTESHEKIRVFDRGVEAIRRTDTFGEFQFDYRYGDIVSPFIHFDEPLRLECLHFVESISESRTPSTDGHNGLRVVEIIEAAQRSLRKAGSAEPVAFGSPREKGLPEGHEFEESA